MQVILARSAGFCFGVKRALDMAEKTANTGQAYTYGPLIHNSQVVERLEQQGLRPINDLTEGRGTVIIRSHGVAPEVYAQGEELKLELVDATCPFVQKAQRLAMQFQQQGRQVILVGDRSHPEVQGIIGWTGNQGLVVENPAEAKQLPPLGPVAVLAQTTQPEQNFSAVVEELRTKSPDVVVHNTICSATGERQKAALELASQVEIMIVVGGKNSANTRKLMSLCQKTGTVTYQVETAEELEPSWFAGANSAGLTAGASTPDWIIEEVYKKMSEISTHDEQVSDEASYDIEDMANWEQSLQDLRRGKMVSGTVVQITSDEVLVDIGGKSEGVLPINELAVKRPNHPSEVVAIGDKINVVILRVENKEGYPVLSKRRADQLQSAGSLEEAFQTGQELQAEVVDVVKGGLLVDIGMRGFVPASQIQRGYVEDLRQFLGKTLRLRILEFDRDKNKIVLSQKIILEEEAKLAKVALWETLTEGQVVTGVVRRLVTFGAFVDIGGIDGLLHISDMTYGHIKHPSEVVKENQQVEVRVLKVDREHERVSLGLKQALTDPWEDVAAKFSVGTVVTGQVVRLAPFGAFVKLAEGIDGLIHISQLSDRHIAKPDEVVQVGQTVKVKIIDCNGAERRISLSLKDVAGADVDSEATEMIEQQVHDLGATIGEAVGHPTAE
ncbi:MAG: bifunctional 4-hydroxy-3-methylbut-2-enyl diphosphate reductase/30S ribosomal protein S1 [Peptococcaceae bacterium]|nr:bifunctional 4-hydroxy-3-methylbut-2-enyl diphosphate reductase/30S ribosomal protein S1 [Peptococcaceae bacterium]